MAFPVVESLTATPFNADTTAHAVPMPATVNAGDLLITIIGQDGNSTLATPSGWTSLGQALNSTDVRYASAYRIADGTEGGTTVDWVTSAVQTLAAHVYRISAWHGTTPPEDATAVTGASTAPNPPSLTPSWGAADTLWLATFAADSAGTTSAYPTNYTNGTTTNTSAGAGECRVASARRELNATSEDPSAFTIPTEEWIANIIAIPPVAGSATVTPAVTARVVLLPTPTILAAALLTPAVVPLVATLPTPSIAAAATVTPAVIPLTVLLPTPTIDVVGGPVTVTPAVIAAIAALPTPIISIDAVVTPAGIAIVVTVPNPTLTIPGLVTPATIPIIVALPSAGVTAGAITFWSRDPVGYVKIGAGDQPPWN